MHIGKNGVFGAQDPPQFQAHSRLERALRLRGGCEAAARPHAPAPPVTDTEEMPPLTPTAPRTSSSLKSDSATRLTAVKKCVSKATREMTGSEKCLK